MTKRQKEIADKLLAERERPVGWRTLRDINQAWLDSLGLKCTVKEAREAVKARWQHDEMLALEAEKRERVAENIRMARQDNLHKLFPQVYQAIKQNAVREPENVETFLHEVECNWNGKRKRSGREYVSDYSLVGIRTKDNGKHGRRRVVWHYQRIFAHQLDEHHVFVASNFELALFTVKVSKLDGTIYFKRKDGEAKKDFVVQPQERMTPAQFIRIARRFLRPGESLVEDDEVPVLLDNVHREAFHMKFFWYNQRVTDELNLAREAIQSRRLEKYEQALREKVLNSDLSRVVVTFEDSIRAGNCQFGTEKFVNELLARFKAQYPRLRSLKRLKAKRLLEIRNDAFTQRAVIAAYRRVTEQQNGGSPHAKES